MSDLAKRWRNIPKSELAALDVGTLWNAIDDLVDENERLRVWSSDSHVTELEEEIERLGRALDRAVVSLNTPNPTGIVYTRQWLKGEE